MITISLASMIGMKKDSKLHFSVLKITISNTIEFLNTLGTFTQAMTKWQIGCIGKLVNINLTTLMEMRIVLLTFIGFIPMDFGMMHIVNTKTGLFVKKSSKAMIMEIRNMNKFNKSSKLVIFLEFFFFEFTIFFPQKPSIIRVDYACKVSSSQVKGVSKISKHFGIFLEINK